MKGCNGINMLRMTDNINKKWEKVGGKWVEKKKAEEMWESEKGFDILTFKIFKRKT